jgi:hypothetical protein
MPVETQKDRDRIEAVLAKRKERQLFEPWELEALEEHTLKCVECMRAVLHPDKYKRCEAMRVWMTKANAYEYEIQTTAKTCSWCKTPAQHKAKVEEQKARHPELHRRLWEGVAWVFKPRSNWGDYGNYVRIQWAVSSFQVIVGDQQGTEELVYHQYAQIE